MVAFLQHALQTYGYAVVVIVVLVESLGVPLPGETVLLVAAAYAGAGHLHVWGVIAAAALGAIVGDSIGYELGKRGGRELLARYGRVLHLREEHLQRAERFFARYGDATVFLGRFVALLRAFSAFLAGLNRMPYRRFLLFNAAGGVVWAVTFGLLGAAFGSQWPLIERWAGRAGVLIALLLALVGGALLLWRYLAAHEAVLRARWQRFLRRPAVAAFRARFAPQLAFLQARLSPQGYLGLHLTIGVVGIVAAAWLFGGITEDVLHGDPLVQLDQRVEQFLVTHREAPFTTAMAIVSLFGSPALVLLVSALVGIVFGLRRDRRACALLLITVAGAEAIDLLIKCIVGRSRPTPLGSILTVGGYSFPSGHAMGSIAFYGIVVYLIVRRTHVWSRRAAAVVFGGLLVILIGFSRLYLGVHYLSDVLAGYAAGLVWLLLVVTGVETLARRRATLEAQAAAPPPVTP